MTQPIFRPAAAADVEEAYRWYEAQRLGLGEKFLEAVSACLEAIADIPELHAVIHRATRRSLIRRFPYALYYRVVGNQVVVVACMHASRNPRRWQARE